MSPFIQEPFDPQMEKVFCSKCGQQCVALGHMTGRLLLCPIHGEFTIAPLVTLTTEGWMINFYNAIQQASWKTCKLIDKHIQKKK